MAVVCWEGSANKMGGGCKPDLVWRSQLGVDLWFGESYLVLGSQVGSLAPCALEM